MRPLLALGLVLVCACAATIVPPEPAAPREALPVQASFERTWDATIDAFAAQNIPIHNMERASGFIATDDLSIGEQRVALADCGTLSDAEPAGDQRTAPKLQPNRVTYNVVVRGDSAAATVQVTPRWTYVSDLVRVHSDGAIGRQAPLECVSTGAWETVFETGIKARAERAQASR